MFTKIKIKTHEIKKSKCQPYAIKYQKHQSYAIKKSKKPLQYPSNSKIRQLENKPELKYTKNQIKLKKF